MLNPLRKLIRPSLLICYILINKIQYFLIKVPTFLIITETKTPLKHSTNTYKVIFYFTIQVLILPILSEGIYLVKMGLGAFMVQKMSKGMNKASEKVSLKLGKECRKTKVWEPG